MILLVAYDLTREVKRPNIVGEIRKTAWARLSESSYLIDTNESVEQVHARFRHHLDGDDDFFVMTVGKRYTGYGPKDVVAWMDARIPYSAAA
jgi:CRISPR/Cas system-associated endoribonuclease Cas2